MSEPEMNNEQAMIQGTKIPLVYLTCAFSEVADAVERTIEKRLNLPRVTVQDVARSRGREIVVAAMLLNFSVPNDVLEALCGRPEAYQKCLIEDWARSSGRFGELVP